MKTSTRRTLPLSALVLAGALALTPLLARGTGTAPAPAPLPPVGTPAPPQTTPVGIQIAAGDHAVAVEHTLADGTVCLIVVTLPGGAALSCPTPAPMPPAPPAPTGGATP